MIGIIVTGHGNFASGMTSAIKLIGGTPKDYAYVDFPEGDSTANLVEKLKRAMYELRDSSEILVFSDLAGGSPFKTAVEVSMESGKTVEVIAGSNLPMVLETITTREFADDFHALVEGAIKTGREQVVKFQFTERKDDIMEDGI